MSGDGNGSNGGGSGGDGEVAVMAVQFPAMREMNAAAL